MNEQKKDIIGFVNEQSANGKTITATLKEIGIKSSTYYSWLKPAGQTRAKICKAAMLTPTEKRAIEDAKEDNPLMRHRQIQGILQMKGLYLSHSSVYHHLKSLDKVEPYERRPSPLKEPRYSVWRRNIMWGCDWTKLLISHIRWYLIIVIDFFSRYIVAFGIYPSINASHVKHVYVAGLKTQGIYKSPSLPDLRTDRGSPNTSWVTKEFFALMGADLSYARVRRPTDNALTERFFGTVKQEEIHIVGSYPDEISARYEIGRYIDHYNTHRPHQSLWNFTPHRVHEVNNNTLILQELNDLKHRSRLARKLYWEGRQG
jgi:transposase InsO family protein